MGNCYYVKVLLEALHDTCTKAGLFTDFLACVAAIQWNLSKRIFLLKDISVNVSSHCNTSSIL